LLNLEKNLGLGLTGVTGPLDGACAAAPSLTEVTKVEVDVWMTLPTRCEADADEDKEDLSTGLDSGGCTPIRPNEMGDIGVARRMPRGWPMATIWNSSSGRPNSSATISKIFCIIKHGFGTSLRLVQHERT